MVKGLETFKRYFAKYTDNYILIGGTACNIHEETFAQNPRATKDFDIIIIVEALSAQFVTEFWNFIKEGGYTTRQRGTHQHEYFRFLNPSKREFPQQLELFARKIGLLNFPDNATIEPIPMDEDLSSLSAILMNDDYYNLTMKYSEVIEDIHIASVESLICLKAKAFIDMKARKQSGEKIDSKNIEKHKKDIFRLVSMLPANKIVTTSENIKNDLKTFCEEIKNELPNQDFFKVIGLPNTTSEEAFTILKAIFSIE